MKIPQEKGGHRLVLLQMLLVQVAAVVVQEEMVAVVEATEPEPLAEEKMMAAGVRKFF